MQKNEMLMVCYNILDGFDNPKKRDGVLDAGRKYVEMEYNTRIEGEMLPEIYLEIAAS